MGEDQPSPVDSNIPLCLHHSAKSDFATENILLSTGERICNPTLDTEDWITQSNSVLLIQPARESDSGH